MAAKRNWDISGLPLHNQRVLSSSDMIAILERPEDHLLPFPLVSHGRSSDWINLWFDLMLLFWDFQCFCYHQRDSLMFNVPFFLELHCSPNLNSWFINLFSLWLLGKKHWSCHINVVLILHNSGRSLGPKHVTGNLWRLFRYLFQSSY